MLFHQDIVPSCANARENNPRRDIAGQERFICAPESNTVRVLHCNSSLHCETFVASLGFRILRDVEAFTSTAHSSLLPSPATTNPDPPSHSQRLAARDRAAGLP